MTRADAVKFLDLYLDNRRAVHDAVPEGLRLVDPITGIHVWDVRPLIEVLGVKYEHKYDPTLEEYPHRLSFKYNGVDVFAIYTEEQFKEVNEWMTRE